MCAVKCIIDQNGMGIVLERRPDTSRPGFVDDITLIDEAEMRFTTSQLEERHKNKTSVEKTKVMPLAMEPVALLQMGRNEDLEMVNKVVYLSSTIWYKMVI